MTARDFVLSAMQKGGDVSAGISGYHMTKPVTGFDKPVYTRIHPGQKKTFID